MTCGDVDPQVTPYIDGACPEAARAAIAAHLRECDGCRTRVEAESAAREALLACAAVARSQGIAPAWRPSAFRLGRPALPARSTALLLAAAVGAVLAGVFLRPRPALAVGVVGDSFCNHEHRFTTVFNVDERTCTLGCVERGAEFVLVTDTQVYRIRNQERPDLAQFANRRVNVYGAFDGDRIVIDRMTDADARAEPPAGGRL